MERKWKRYIGAGVIALSAYATPVVANEDEINSQVGTAMLCDSLERIEQIARQALAVNEEDHDEMAVAAANVINAEAGAQVCGPGFFEYDSVTAEKAIEVSGTKVLLVKFHIIAKLELIPMRPGHFRGTRTDVFRYAVSDIGRPEGDDI